MSVLHAAPYLPVGEVFQLEDVYRLGVAGGAEELGVRAEHQGADGHIPRKQRDGWTWEPEKMSSKSSFLRL